MPEDCGDVGKQEAISQQPHIRVVYGPLLDKQDLSFFLWQKVLKN